MKLGDIVTHIFGCIRCGVVIDTKVKEHPMGFSFSHEHVYVMWCDGTIDIHNPNLLRVLNECR